MAKCCIQLKMFYRVFFVKGTILKAVEAQK